MGKYFIEVEKQAKKNLEIQYKSGDKASIRRINQILSNYLNILKSESENLKD